MTTPPNSLTELAERVERLTGPCRETDLAIHLALYRDGKIAQLVANHRRGFDGKIGTAWEIFHTGAVCYETRNEQGRCYSNGGHVLPAVTASLDAAMTLARNNREAMLMIHAAFGSFASDEMDAALNLFPRIKAMLLTNLRARAASESSHDQN